MHNSLICPSSISLLSVTFVLNRSRAIEQSEQSGSLKKSKMGQSFTSLSFPFCLSALSRPHALHSQFFGQTLAKEEIQTAIKSQNFEYFRIHYRHSSKGYQIPYAVWRSYYTRFFPVFTGLINMSREKVFHLFEYW